MASYGFHTGVQRALEGTLNFETADVRVMLVMSNFSGATAGVGDATLDQSGTQARDIASMNLFTTLDQFNGTGYTAPGIALSNQTVTLDTTNHLVKFDSTDAPNWAALDSDASRAISGAIVYLYSGAGNGDGASDFPIAFLDSSELTISVDDTDVTLNFSASGILTIQFS